MNPHSDRPAHQRGAALIVALILLLILTLMAITGMNTATGGLYMAGNEQYRHNAFQASDTGIEAALSVLNTIPQSSTPTVKSNVYVPNSSTETYTTTTRYMGDDLNVPNFSAGKFVGFHFEITSVGKSSRNAAANHRQGAYVIQAAGDGSFGAIK